MPRSLGPQVGSCFPDVQPVAPASFFVKLTPELVDEGSMTSHPFDQNLDQAIESTTFGDVSIIGFQTGSLLDESLVRALESKALNAAVTVERPKLVVDFDGVVHLTSAALGALLTIRREIEGRQGQLVLAGLSPAIDEVFDIACLRPVFEFAADRSAAIDLCQA